MNKEIIATFRAATAKPEYLTLDSLGAGLGGWGAFYLGIWAAANVIGKELKKGKKLELEVGHEEAYTDVDEIAKKSNKTLMNYGADPANAALISAMLLYWAGTGVQCGIPVPNRKLGAVTRIAAGIPSGRVASIPTEKQNNKISGFAATLAIYQALEKEHLAPYDSSLVPMGIAGGPIVGHSSIGEDHLFPKLGQKLGKIGTDGMMKAYLSAGMQPNQWMAALCGTAATLEILHPDAYVGEEFGTYLKTRTPEVIGRAACGAAGLPEKVHVRGTGEELETAKVVGDLAIILKDSATPTVVGMMMFCETCAILQESIFIGAGVAGGPLVLPLSHWVSAPTLALRMLSQGKSETEIATVIGTTVDQYLLSEHAAAATNILARKAEGLEAGPITNAIIRATEPRMSNAIMKRAVYANEQLEKGTSLTDLVKDVQDKQIEAIGNAVASMMKNAMGVDVEYIKFKNVKPGSGRRHHNFALQHFGFDSNVDVELKLNGEVVELKNVVGKAAPDALMSGDKSTLGVLGVVSIGILQIMTIGACSIDVTVCAAMAAARGMDPAEATKEATHAGNVLISIPAPPAMTQCATLAAEIAQGLEF